MKDFHDYQEVITLDGLCRLVVFKNAPPNSSRRLQLSLRAELTIEVSPDTTTQEFPRNVIHVGPTQEQGFLAFQAITRCNQIIGFDLADAIALLGSWRVGVHQIWADRNICSLELTAQLLPYLKNKPSSSMLTFHLPKDFEDTLPFVIEGMGVSVLRDFMRIVSYQSPDQNRIGVTVLAVQEENF